MPKDKNSDLLFKLYAISHQKGIVRKLDFHTHIYYEVFLFHGGECDFLIDNQIYHLQPGDVIVLDGISLHKPFLGGNTDDYERSILQFSLDWVQPLINFLDINHLLDPFEGNHHTVFRTNNNLIFQELDAKIAKIEALFRTQNQDDFLDTEFQIKLLDLLYDIEKLKPYAVHEYDRQSDEKYLYIQEAVDFIKDQYQEKITLEDISEAVNLSKSYLVHLFKELTGYTVMEYIMEYRLIQSFHLMKLYPEMTIKEISSRCGFEDPSHYSRFFKKHTGMSPRQYRETLS